MHGVLLPAVGSISFDLIVVCLVLLVPYFIVGAIFVFFGKSHSNFGTTTLSNQLSVTVFLPTYNEESYIGSKIENLLGQDYPISEILIFDCSTDSTRSIIARYQAQHPEVVKLVCQDRRYGNALTLNEALLQAKGGIVIKTDCDSYCPATNAISNLVANFQDPRIGGATGICKGIGGVEPLFRKVMTRLQIAESNLDSTLIGHSTSLLAFRKSATSPVSPSSMAEDTEELILIRKKGYRTVVDPNTVSIEDVPANDKIRRKQKTRRAQGILDCLIRNRDMFSLRYGRYGTIVLPMELFVLAISPILFTIVIVVFAYALYGLSPFLFLGLCGVLVVVTFLQKNPLKAIIETQMESFVATFNVLFRRANNPVWEKVR